jgi:putative ABC transport system ATP-binding protein
MTILNVAKVSKRFRRGNETVMALDDVSFQVDRPQIVALAGPSGSGKSTLLNMVARFDKSDSGQIFINDEDVGSIPESDLDLFRNRKLGFIFQQFNLVKVLSAVENVELSLLPQGLDKGARRKKALEMLSAVGLKDRVGHRPEQLSGGQQQRVAIARALVGSPRIVVADEPTGSLDGTTACEILTLMKRLNEELETTFIIATHDQRVMDMAHRVITLADGKRIS